ncbi:RNase H domain-containing protein [Trichonephila clavipes]|nr:RNase H domain-containing protein [Trichonephila clavipes]
MDTLAKLSKLDLITAYTNSSSNSECDRGGVLAFSFSLQIKHRVAAGKIAFNFTSELIAIKDVLALYLTQSRMVFTSNGLVIFSDCKSALEVIKGGKVRFAQDINELLSTIVAREKTCTIQWVPTDVNIEGNGHADSLAKEARNIDPSPIKIPCLDVNADAKHRLRDGPRKKWCLP